MGRKRAAKREIEIRGSGPEQSGVCAKCGLNHDKLGVTIEAGTLRRRARASCHMLHDAPAFGSGWAFHSVFVDRHAQDIEWIEIEDIESGRTYSVDGATFRRDSIEINVGAGLQRALRLRYWHISAPATGEELAELMRATPPDRARQAALFTMHGQI